ncbi:MULTISPECIES: PQQ-dependent sugar dehydrogenase [unclassified Halomonas]|uniref:PQQ-dependent sugar dehydrogenase n=1 Tax=unclassified Halomonas TaxID=2609666 RepID=UPI0006D96A44|nr:MULTISPECIES: PQQ-dependent sugar dehydrogenase [unclassified Halomonas]KPQ21081.1 MAG: glucose/sorbosone dehydrogenase family protein [Halomonas sp. HL-93]SBR50525.1 Glucose/arabinose dehydrogenase, beta-propeller fold [Halomonas sp. HL-93]SNY96903.1 Glucose/arabinose dehydrogenase, beta-propeller fold [Halomonas sp. hl-4]
MAKPTGVVPIVIHFIAALLTGVVLGSVVQTQFNLAALRTMGVRIPLEQSVATTLQDLASFAPLYALLFGLGFVFSQTAAVLLSRWLGGRFLALLCAGGAAVGLWATLWLVNTLAPPPTLIAATRGTAGLIAMLATAGVAGWLFALLRRRAGYAKRPRGFSGMALVLGVGSLAAALPGVSQPVEAQEDRSYYIETLADGLEHPWSLAFLPDGRMLVTERPGRLRLLSGKGETVVESLSGVPDVFVSGQAGLFDVRVSPQFEDDQQVYLSYACGNTDANHTCLAKGTLAENGLEDVSEIFRTQPAKQGAAHFGGRMAWLADGTLILTLGDGFDYREQAQNLGSHIGSTVRLNPDGSPPGDNPFALAHDGARPEIYSYGHRNVQGVVFDDDNQRLLAHEHGPRGGDEINIIKAGSNYGWPLATGGLDYTGARISPFTEYPGTVSPVLEWTPSIAPSGMVRYTGEMFPEWQGDLLVGALVNKEVRRVRVSDNGTSAEDVEGLFGELDERIRDVREGPEGAIYLLTDSPEGRLLRVTPAHATEAGNE